MDMNVGGKTGTADKVKNGVYTKDKINTFVSIFPISKPKFVLVVLLDEPKPSKRIIFIIIEMEELHIKVIGEIPQVGPQY